MKWQVRYALQNILENLKEVSACHIDGEAIAIEVPGQAKAIAVISAADVINSELARQYHLEYQDMDFLCGYRKGCIWEGEAIKYLEGNGLGRLAPESLVVT